MVPRLLLYSSHVDQRVAEVLPAKEAKVGYLPSSPDPTRKWFEPIKATYNSWGASLRYFGLEEEFEPHTMEPLFECDAIHLTGGNTFQFLYWLRYRGLIDGLRRFVSCGGVLIGVSAGGILMTPDTNPSFLCGDEPYLGLTDLSGLCVVPFAFAPHYDGADSSTTALIAYADRFGGTVYAVRDGGGIEVRGAEIIPFGSVSMVQKGGVKLLNG